MGGLDLSGQFGVALHEGGNDVGGLPLGQLAYVKAARVVTGNDGDMKRDELLQRLVDAKLDARRAQERIREQKSLIASLIREGSNVDEAEQSLQAFERLQDEHLAEIESFKNALTGKRAQ